jgi:hypothetical protein
MYFGLQFRDFSPKNWLYVSGPVVRQNIMVASGCSGAEVLIS